MARKSQKPFQAPEVNIISEQSDAAIDPKEVEILVQRVLETKKVHCSEISFHFVSVETISSLHNTYFNDPTPTDCITFPMDEEEDSLGYRILGEVFICPKVAIDYAKDHGIDPSKELSLYIIHGILHLLGYNDIESKERSTMRRQERLLMKLLEDEKCIPLIAIH